MIALEARDLVIEVGGKIVVRDLSFDLRAGDKIGVVGRNGAGKTSTMKVLAGEEEPGGGTLVRRGAVGYLRQDPRQHRAEDDDLALEHVLEARGLVDLSRRLEKARVGLAESHDERSIRRFSRLEEEYTMLGGYQAEATAKTIVAGLGLAEDRLRLPVKTLSGGERRRLELAKILFGGSDVLLLDEPTNHLDVDAKTWLMKFLASYKGALMVISHDIGLLDASITRILHLDVEGVVEYKGTYTQYRTARAVDEQRLTKLAARQTAEIKRLKTLADSMRGQTVKRARVAKSLDSRVARLESAKVEGPTREKRVRFRFPEPPHCGRTVLVVEDLAKSYGGPPVFTDVSFSIGRGERLLILGLNGAGQDEPAADPDGADRRRRWHVRVRLRGGARLLRAGARADPRRRVRAAAHEGLLDGGRSDAPVAARDVRTARRHRVPGRGDAVGRGEDEARARAARRRPEEPVAARRADEQPRPAVTDRDRDGLAGMAGRDGDREPRSRIRRSACPGEGPVDA